VNEPVQLPPQFPLAWPDEWQRTPRGNRGLLSSAARAAGAAGGFKVGAPRAYDLIEHELENWGVISFRGTNGYPSRRLWVVTSNMQSRLAGKPNSEGTGYSDDPGVAVWWSVCDEGLRVVACDTWTTVAQNMRACGVIIESLRAMERAGASQALGRAQIAITALGLPSEREWWRVALDLPRGEFTTGDVERAYKRAAIVAHPDQGGTHEAFVTLTRARGEALLRASGTRSAAGAR
jgi:hypothetical protein